MGGAGPRPAEALSAVLFDLDGTLIDTIELIRRSFWHTLQVHGRQDLGREFWRRGIGRPLEVQLRDLCADARELAAMVHTYREFNSREHDALVSAYPGIPEAIEGLVARDLRLAVVTSKARAHAERGLRHTGLERHFEVLVGADEVTHPKPHPEPVQRALELLGVAAARAAFVGDSPFDLRCGRAAGVRAVGVAWGAGRPEELAAESPERVLGSPEELADL